MGGFGREGKVGWGKIAEPFFPAVTVLAAPIKDTDIESPVGRAVLSTLVLVQNIDVLHARRCLRILNRSIISAPFSPPMSVLIVGRERDSLGQQVERLLLRRFVSPTFEWEGVFPRRRLLGSTHTSVLIW